MKKPKTSASDGMCLELLRWSDQNEEASRNVPQIPSIGLGHCSRRLRLRI